jgi:hypothetical protein
MIKISINKQILEYYKNNELIDSYSISSAKNGIGEKNNSFCTPSGKHRIHNKIGEGLACNSVFVARKFTGEIYSSKLFKKYPNRDWILTRIIWLEGIENHNKNTLNRYIYIHGSPDEVQMGVPGSKGCIRMNNEDIIKLFNKVKINENVIINL